MTSYMTYDDGASPIGAGRHRPGEVQPSMGKGLLINAHIVHVRKDMDAQGERGAGWSCLAQVGIRTKAANHQAMDAQETLSALSPLNLTPQHL